MQGEVDHKVCVTPSVSFTVVSDPDCWGRFCQQLCQEEHDADDEEGVDNCFPNCKFKHFRSDEGGQFNITSLITGIISNHTFLSCQRENILYQQLINI